MYYESNYRHRKKYRLKPVPIICVLLAFAIIIGGIYFLFFKKDKYADYKIYNENNKNAVSKETAFTYFCLNFSSAQNGEAEVDYAGKQSWGFVHSQCFRYPQNHKRNKNCDNKCFLAHNLPPNHSMLIITNDRQ